MNKTIRAGVVAATNLLKAQAVTLQKGDAAPAFVASSTVGEIDLGRLIEEGPVVLALYPADFTPG